MQQAFAGSIASQASGSNGRAVRTRGPRAAPGRCGPLHAGLFVLVCALARGQNLHTPESTIAGTAEPLSQGEIRELLRQVAERDLENDKKLRDYTYVQRAEEHKFNGKGGVKSSESKTYEVMQLYGEQVERLIEKNDKPLGENDARKEEAKIQKLIDKRKKESEKDREKRREKEAKNREEGRQFVKEVADAYNFRQAGMELLEGRDTYVIDGEPRPGYQAHLKEARILPKFRFRAWIDKAELQWKKLDIQCIDTVSFGLFLARLNKGSRMIVEQTRVNGEVWLPQHVALKLDARIALLKGFNLEEDLTFRDYKKFGADTKIVIGGEAPERH